MWALIFSNLGTSSGLYDTSRLPVSSPIIRPYGAQLAQVPWKINAQLDLICDIVVDINIKCFFLV